MRRHVYGRQSRPSKREMMMCRRRSSDWGVKGLAAQRALVYTAMTRAQSMLYLLVEDFRWEWVRSSTERQHLGNQLWRSIAEVSERHIRTYWQEDPQWVGDTTAVVQPWWSRSRSFQGIQGMASVPWSVYQLLSSEYDDWHYAPEPVTDGDVVLFSNVDAWKTFLESSQEPRRLVQAPRGLEQYGWRSETVRAAPAGIMQFWRSRLIQAVTITYQGGEGYILQLPVLRPEHHLEDVTWSFFWGYWGRLQTFALGSTGVMPRIVCCSPHWRVGFLFLVLYPRLVLFLLPALSPSLTFTYSPTQTHSHSHTHSHSLTIGSRGQRPKQAGPVKAFGYQCPC